VGPLRGQRIHLTDVVGPLRGQRIHLTVAILINREERAWVMIRPEACETFNFELHRQLAGVLAGVLANE
jgi:hypothetical protein